jgi:hypothetical protein
MSLELKRLDDFDAYRVNFKGQGMQSGIALAGQTTNLDFQLSEDRLIYGGQAILKDHVYGDKITMQIIHKAGGVDSILGEYVKDWAIAEDVQAQGAIMVTYPTKVTAGLYMRIKYVSTGGVDVKVNVNVFAVKNVTE